MTARLARGAAVLLAASFTFHFMLPVETGIPGFSTFTLTKLAGLAMAAATAAWLLAPGGRDRVAGTAGSLWPWWALAALLPALAFRHPEFRGLDLRLLAGFAGGAVVGAGLAAVLREEAARRPVLRVLVWGGGALALAGGVLEPLTSPAWDGLWRWFRPYQPVFNPVAGRSMELAMVHWQWGPLFRVSGFFADPNHLAGFLDLWLPLTVCALIAAPPRQRVARVGAWLAVAGVALVLASTLTRSAVLAAAAGGALLALARAAEGARRGAQRRLALGLVAAAAVGGLVLAGAGTLSAASLALAGAASLGVFGALVPGRGARPLAWAAALILLALPLAGRLSAASAARLAGAPAEAVSWRAKVWRHSLLAIREAPLAGLGTHALYARLLRDPAIANPGVSESHNLYLTTAVAGGLVAAGLLLHGLGMLLWLAWRRALANPGAPVAVAMAWYWTTFVLLGLVGQSIFPVNEALFFFFCAGLTVAVCARPAPPVTPRLDAVLAGARRGAVRVLFASLCFYFLFPVQTPIPGFATFTLVKAVSLLLLALSLPTWMAAPTRRALLAGARPLAPLAVLALWLPLVSLPRPEYGRLDAKMLAGLAVGVALCLVVLRELRDVRERRRVMTIVLALGLVAVAAALAEPLLPPAADGFWRWFRPDLAVWSPVLGRTSVLADVHWDHGGIYRVSGIFSNPNELANFLALWFPLLGAALAARPPRTRAGRLGAALAAVAAAAAFTLTMTRSSLLGAGAGCAAALVLVAAARLAARVPPRGVPAPAWAALAGLLLLAADFARRVAGHRVSALTVALTGAAAVALVAVAARSALRRGTDGPLGRTVTAAAALGLLLLLAPVVLLGPGPVALLRGAAAAVPSAGWWPEHEYPATPTQRFTESAVHAGWQRQKLWRVACWELADAPLTGPGYHHYFAVIQSRNPRTVRADLDAARGDIDAGVDNPHNLYLTAAIAGGVVGLGLLLHGLLVLARAALAAALDRAAAAGDRALGFALLWYWCAYAGMGLVGHNVFTINEGLVFFALAALTLAARRAAR